MNEIKFRGQRVDTKEWVYGKVIKIVETNQYFILPLGSNIYDGMDIPGLDKKNNGLFLIVEAVSVLPETVGQFTGLHDKNGKEIYEGDILKVYVNEFDNPNDCGEGETMFEHEYITSVKGLESAFSVDVVECDYGSTAIQFLEYTYDNYEIEVIGNIHDNPELLK